MSNTRLPREQLKSYFDTFTKRFLTDRSPEAVDIEVIGTLGDQHAVEGTRLMGISYDSRDDELDIFFDAGDHRITEPQEVWVREEGDGFVSSIEIVRPDGDREIVNLHRMDTGRRH